LCARSKKEDFSYKTTIVSASPEALKLSKKENSEPFASRYH